MSSCTYVFPFSLNLQQGSFAESPKSARAIPPPLDLATLLSILKPPIHRGSFPCLLPLKQTNHRK